MKKIAIFPILVFSLASCAGNIPHSQPSKYGTNAFITEDGTCYIGDRSNNDNAIFSYVILRADGTGSAFKRHSADNFGGWEFIYLIDKDNKICIPFAYGQFLKFDCSINPETKFREISYYGGKFVEFCETSTAYFYSN